MANNSPRKNAIGVAVKMTITEDGAAIDLSGVTAKDIRFLKPNGVELTKAASFITNGSDGRLQYITQSGDLDTAGIWRVKAALTFIGGYSGGTDVGHFVVKDDWEG